MRKVAVYIYRSVHSMINAIWPSSDDRTAAMRKVYSCVAVS